MIIYSLRIRALAALILLGVCVCGCTRSAEVQQETVTVIDQLGRTVEVPRRIDRIAALHHFGGKIVYALRQQDKLVDQSLYSMEAQAMERVDERFAALPKLLDGREISVEQMVSLKPQIAFVYASFDRAEMKQLTNAGISVVAVRGETLKESFDAVNLVARVLGCQDAADVYVKDCTALLSLVAQRLKNIPPDRKARVMFAGPKSIYSVATGEMLQTEILELAGAANVAKGLKGFWTDVSPEQVALWNPDVIFIGSSLQTYGMDEVVRNSQFATVAAIRNNRVYTFPSNIGWWDYPAPHCVLGVLWTAGTLYPERFADVDIVKTADEFYAKYLGYSFTSMGGKL
jgi:iron complex transport system substrate-binding protein